MTVEAGPYQVQAFNTDGTPQPTVDSELQRQQNFVKAFQGYTVQVDSSQSSSSTNVDIDVAAVKQRGDLQEKGFYGDQSLTNEQAAFNKAVSLASSLSGLGSTLSSISESSRAGTTRNKFSNYFLYDREKQLLQKRAGEFASFGVIPYDALEEFLYILVSVETYEDLSFISKVTGIMELDNPGLVREPERLLNLPNLFMVGYLANAVKVVDLAFDPKFDAGAASDSEQSAFGMVLAAAAAGAALSQFPAVDIVSDLVGDLTSQIATTAGITALFSGVPNLGMIGQLGSVAGQMTNLSSSILDTAKVVATTGVNGMVPAAGMLSSLARRAQFVSDQVTQLSSISQMATNPDKIPDIAKQMTKINSLVGSLASQAGSITSLLGSLGVPSISGQAAGVLLSKLGGMAPSGIITELTIGQRMPPSVLYKNPMLTPPSYHGKAFFGEMITPQGAVDQLFCKKIASFSSNQGGGGTSSFGMQNFGSLGVPGLNLTNMVSKMLLGTTTPPLTGALANIVNSKVAQVASIVGATASTVIEPRRSDNSIPFMIGMAAALVDDTKSPFSTSEFSNSWKYASSVGNEVQRYNPSYLRTCVTAL